MLKKFGLLFAIIILFFLGVSISNTGQLDSPKEELKPGLYKVEDISDGDTIKVRIAGKTETVRLIGIDTPETKDPRTGVQCFGKIASEKMAHLVKDRWVRLEADTQSDDRDRYGRLLRYVYLEDGTFINQKMVEEGYAFAYTLYPNDKLEKFRDCERLARENNRGLWSGCSVNETKQKKQTNLEATP